MDGFTENVRGKRMKGYVLRTIEELNSKGYDVDFTETPKGRFIEVYSSENSIIKKLEFSSGGFYPEESYIYSLQEIMTEINIGETE